MHHRPDLDVALFLVRLRQTDLAQMFQTLRSAVGQIRKTPSGKHVHFGVMKSSAEEDRNAEAAGTRILGVPSKNRASLSAAGQTEALPRLQMP